MLSLLSWILRSQFSQLHFSFFFSFLFISVFVTNAYCVNIACLLLFNYILCVYIYLFVIYVWHLSFPLNEIKSTWLECVLILSSTFPEVVYWGRKYWGSICWELLSSIKHCHTKNMLAIFLKRFARCRCLRVVPFGKSVFAVRVSSKLSATGTKSRGRGFAL